MIRYTYEVHINMYIHIYTNTSCVLSRYVMSPFCPPHCPRSQIHSCLPTCRGYMKRWRPERLAAQGKISRPQQANNRRPVCWTS